MRWLEANSFFESFRPVYLATKIFHIHFETFDFQHKTTRRTLVDQVRFVLSILADFYLASRGIRTSTGYLRLTDSVLLNVGCYSSIVLLYLFSSTIPLWNRYKSKGVFQICVNFSNCDEELQILGISIDHRKHYIASILFLFCWMALATLVLSVGVSARFSEAWYCISTATPDFLTVLAVFRTSTCFSMFVCYTCLTLYSIKDRLNRLRDAMTKHLGGDSLAALPGDGTEYDRVCSLIRCLSKVHDQLSDTIQLFNSSFYVHVMYALTTAAWFTVFTVFGLIHTYAAEENAITIWVTWNNILYDIFYVILILQLVIFASVVSSDCQGISIVVHKAICYGPRTGRIVKDLNCFSKQLSHHAPKISCGWFDLDWTLLYSMAGSFTTYLVVLLQFDLANLNYTH